MAKAIAKAGTTVYFPDGSVGFVTEGGNYRIGTKQNPGKLWTGATPSLSPSAPAPTPAPTPTPAPAPAPAPGGLNQAAFMELQRVTEAAGRRITPEEWASVGGDPSQYYKLYGDPAPVTPTPTPAPAPAPVGPPTTSGAFDFGKTFGTATNLDQGAFQALQRQSEQEGRRITMQEWQSVGGSPYDYYKLYGSPDQAQITGLLNLAQSQNRRLTLEEFLSVGGDPNQYYKLYGEGNPDPVRMQEALNRAKEEGRRITLQEWIAAGGNPWQYEKETAKSPHEKEIAVPGTDTKKTEIGDAREINPATIAETALAKKTDIAPVLNASVDAGTLAQQQAFVDTLRQQAAGQGPSLAGLQIQQALERALKNQMGALASNPGISAALAARLFGQQSAQQTQEAAMAGAQTRIQEQLNAQGQLGGALNQIQDAQTRVALANQLAGNTQNYNQAQLYQEVETKNAAAAALRATEQAKLAQDAAKANQSAFNTGNISQAQITGGITQAQLAAEAQKAAAAAAAEATKAAANTNAEAAVTINASNNANTAEPTTAGPTSDDTVPGPGNPSVTGSDKKMKKNVSDGSGDARDMMEKLAAAIFEYKDKNQGDGKQVGVMAQDLEKSDLGKQMVDEKGGKKWVNFAKGLGAVLAAQADLNKRMKKMEASA